MMSPLDAHLIEDEVPALQSAFQRYNKSKPLAQKAKVLKSVDKTWKTNITMIDLEWLKNQPKSAVDIDVGHNPFELGLLLQRTGQAGSGDVSGLIEIVGFWFAAVGEALRNLKPRIKIELCAGDATQVLEQIRHGAVGHRQQSKPSPVTDLAADIHVTTISEQDETDQTSSHAAGNPEQLPKSSVGRPIQPEEYPKLYDRIHLSNIPDYIGGTLTTFIYALPLTHPGKMSYITSNCLRNPLHWISAAHFNNEYIALSSPVDLEKVFHVRMAPPKHPNEPMPMAD